MIFASITGAPTGDITYSWNGGQLFGQCAVYRWSGDREQRREREREDGEEEGSGGDRETERERERERLREREREREVRRRRFESVPVSLSRLARGERDRYRKQSYTLFR